MQLSFFLIFFFITGKWVNLNTLKELVLIFASVDISLGKTPEYFRLNTMGSVFDYILFISR